jgi:acetyl-CoA acetyltransferase
MRRHAGLNPQAKYREPITVEEVLASRMVSSRCHLLDCCVISDGGGALVLTSLERARDLRKAARRHPRRRGGRRHGGRGVRDVLDIAGGAVGPAALRARGSPARRRRPVHGLRLVHHHVLATLEALGFCRPGEGGAFCAAAASPRRRAAGESGRGRAVVQPSGMRGIFLVVEATRQLRGECGRGRWRTRRSRSCTGRAASSASATAG